MEGWPHGEARHGHGRHTRHHVSLRRRHPVLLSLSPVGRAIAERIRHRGRSRCADPELLAEVDALRQEVSELHERVDFTERLLANQKSERRSSRGAEMTKQIPTPPTRSIPTSFSSNGDAPAVLVMIVLAALAGDDHHPLADHAGAGPEAGAQGRLRSGAPGRDRAGASAADGSGGAPGPGGRAGGAARFRRTSAGAEPGARAAPR